jgi:hypothetical protein
MAGYALPTTTVAHHVTVLYPSQRTRRSNDYSSCLLSSSNYCSGINLETYFPSSAVLWVCAHRNGTADGNGALLMVNDNDVPHIQACCAECGFLYDMKWGLSCPACNHVGVRWARSFTCTTCGDSGNVHGEPCVGCSPIPQHKDYPGRLCSPYAHTESEQKDISELDRMYNLKDQRSQL